MKMFFLFIWVAATIGCNTAPVNFGGKNGAPKWSVTVVDDIHDMPGDPARHVWGSNGYSARFQTPRDIYSRSRYQDERGGYTTTTTTQYDSWAGYRTKSSSGSGRSREQQKKDFLRRSRALDNR